MTSPLKGILNSVGRGSPVLSPRKMEITPLVLTEYKTRMPSAILPSTEPERIVPSRILDAPGLEDDYYLNLLSWSTEGLLAVGLGCKVHVWDARTGKARCVALLRDKITSVAWSPDGLLAIGSRTGNVELLDVTSGKRTILSCHSARVGVLAWQGSLLTSGSRDRSLLHHDPRRRPANRICEAHEQEICGLQWDRCGRLASGGNDNAVCIWDARMTSPLQRWIEHTAAVKALAWSPTRNGVLASGGGTADRCIRLWTVHSGLLSTHKTASQVCALAWSDEELCSTHGFSEHLCLRWDALMHVTAVMRGHSQRVLYMAAAPDGVNVATGSADETIRIWPVFTPHTKRCDLIDSVDFR
jgi:WD40 repeat protein